MADFEIFSKTMKMPLPKITKRELDKLTSRQLKLYASEKGIKVSSNLSKSERLDFILTTRDKIKRMGLKPKRIWLIGNEVYTFSYKNALRYIKTDKKLYKEDIWEKIYWQKGRELYQIKHKFKKVELVKLKGYNYAYVEKR